MALVDAGTCDTFYRVFNSSGFGAPAFCGSCCGSYAKPPVSPAAAVATPPPPPPPPPPSLSPCASPPPVTDPPIAVKLLSAGAVLQPAFKLDNFRYTLALQNTSAPNLTVVMLRGTADAVCWDRTGTMATAPKARLDPNTERLSLPVGAGREASACELRISPTQPSPARDALAQKFTLLVLPPPDSAAAAPAQAPAGVVILGLSFIALFVVVIARLWREHRASSRRKLAADFGLEREGGSWGGYHFMEL